MWQTLLVFPTLEGKPRFRHSISLLRQRGWFLSSVWRSREQDSPTEPLSCLVGGVAAWLLLNKEGTSPGCLFAALADKDQVSSLHVSSNGSLSKQQTVASGGLTPVHLQLIQGGRILLVANYHGPDDASGPGGSVASFLVDSECSLTLADSIPHSGSSVDPARQNTAHPHSIVAEVPAVDSGVVLAFVCDLGMDRVFTYSVNMATAQMTEVARAATTPGSGPRHSAIDSQRRVLYVIHEMGNFLESFLIQLDGSLKASVKVSSLPSNFTKFSKAAEVLLLDGFVFVTNRGANTIASFSAVDLNPLEHTSSCGNFPRGLSVWDAQSRTYWFVANQDSSSLALFEGTGSKLTYLDVNISVPNPVTITIGQSS